MEIFFTSDTHYHQKNICLGTSKWLDKSKCRNFETVEDMNTAILAGINNNIGPKDTLYHLGDFSFGGIDKAILFRESINCKTVHLIYGNHDFNIETNVKYQYLFKSCQFYLYKKIFGRQFILNHYPLLSWQKIHRNSIHCFGHCHNNLTEFIKTTLPNRKMIDVGIDSAYNKFGEYRPFHVDEIIKLVDSRDNYVGYNS